MCVHKTLYLNIVYKMYKTKNMIITSNIQYSIKNIFTLDIDGSTNRPFLLKIIVSDL